MVYQERDHVDSATPGRARQTFAARYDAVLWLSRLRSIGWGTKHCPSPAVSTMTTGGSKTASSGRTALRTIRVSTTPLEPELSRGSIHRSWRQSAGATPSVVGLNETWMNLFGKPSQTVALDASQKIAKQTFLYDGLGRCIQTSNPLQYVTHYSYDARSRLISNTLPDDTVVKRTYADHSASQLPVALVVNGNKRHQSHGGRTSVRWPRTPDPTSGQRTERYVYEVASYRSNRKSPPPSRPSPDYNLELTDQPVSSKAPDETASLSMTTPVLA